MTAKSTGRSRLVTVAPLRWDARGGTRGRLARPLVVFLGCAMLLTMWIWQQALVLGQVGDVGELRNRVGTLERVHGDLVARAADLRARPRIERIAHDALGLVPTPPSRIRQVRIAADGVPTNR